jgi:hypothetical protein
MPKTEFLTFPRKPCFIQHFPFLYMELPSNYWHPTCSCHPQFGIFFGASTYSFSSWASSIGSITNLLPLLIHCFPWSWLPSWSGHHHFFSLLLQQHNCVAPMWSLPDFTLDLLESTPNIYLKCKPWFDHCMLCTCIKLSYSTYKYIQIFCVEKVNRIILQ